MKKIKELLLKYKEVILYLFFGGCTTLINIVAYWVFRNVLYLDVVPADIAAWVVSVLFAYITNKRWVFESKSWKGSTVLREAAEFFAARLFTLGLDVLILYITVDRLHWPDLLMKIIANIVVIIVNYLFSKLLIFSKKAGGKNGSDQEEKKSSAPETTAG